MSDNSEYDNVHMYGPGCIENLPRKPDSVIKHQKFSDLMQRYHGQMEIALYAAEQACIHHRVPPPCRNLDCKFNNKVRHCPTCIIPDIRELIGDRVPQHDIQIPEDDTQAQRKRER